MATVIRRGNGVGPTLWIVQLDAHVAVLARICRLGVLARLGNVLGEREGKQCCSLAKIGAHTAGWAATAGPGSR